MLLMPDDACFPLDCLLFKLLEMDHIARSISNNLLESKQFTKQAAGFILFHVQWS